ncbi:MAG: hypothetical protein ACHQJ6_02075 [Candidatus Berkiellales bacterium]
MSIKMPTRGKKISLKTVPNNSPSQSIQESSEEIPFLDDDPIPEHMFDTSTPLSSGSIPLEIDEFYSFLLRSRENSEVEFPLLEKKEPESDDSWLQDENKPSSQPPEEFRFEEVPLEAPVAVIDPFTEFPFQFEDLGGSVSSGYFQMDEIDSANPFDEVMVETPMIPEPKIDMAQEKIEQEKHELNKKQELNDKQELTPETSSGKEEEAKAMKRKRDSESAKNRRDREKQRVKALEKKQKELETENKQLEIRVSEERSIKDSLTKLKEDVTVKLPLSPKKQVGYSPFYAAQQRAAQIPAQIPVQIPVQISAKRTSTNDHELPRRSSRLKK